MILPQPFWEILEGIGFQSAVQFLLYEQLTGLLTQAFPYSQACLHTICVKIFSLQMYSLGGKFLKYKLGIDNL